MSAIPPARRDLVAGATARLAAAGVASPGHDAEELLAHVLGVDRARLPLVREVDEAAAARFAACVARRERREPLQHITGEAPFRHLVLAVGPGVFVPRPETEVVAGWAIEALGRMRRERPLVVDLGTGSGAIALAVATEVTGTRVHAVETDPAAHGWAVRNLAGSGVVLHLGDMADALRDLDGQVDLVVSNPPYIPLWAYEEVAVEARAHDPATALWAGPDGLQAVRTVERTAARLLRPSGLVVVEHAEAQAVSAPAVFRDAGWRDVRDHPDLTGRARFVTAVRPGDRVGAGSERMSP